MNPTVKPKVAAGLFGTFLSAVVLGLLAKYTAFDPDPGMAAGISGLIGFAVAWFVPEELWARYEGIYGGGEEPTPPTVTDGDDTEVTGL